MRYRLVTILAIVVLCFSMFQTGTNFLLDENESLDAAESQWITSNYTPHAPIVINHNQNFTNQGWPGEGTEEEPYAIEGFNITADSTCINVTNTDVHFIIKNCYLSTVSGNNRGVSFTDVENGTVDSCIIERTSSAVYIESSSKCVVDNTTVSGCSEPGIYFRYSSNCNATSNMITDYNLSHGIFAYYSGSCYFDNNTITHCNAGIALSTSPNCLVSNNTVMENRHSGIGTGASANCRFLYNVIANNQGGAISCGADYSTFIENTISNNGDSGVFISLAMHCNFTGNTLVNDSFLVWDSQHYMPDWNHSFIDNTVNGKPVGHFVDQSDLEIDASEYGEVILFNCSDITIKDGVFTTSTAAVELGFCDGCEIVNSTFYGQKKRGIFVQDSPNTAIEGNSFERNVEYVLDMRSSPQSSFCHNTVTETGDIAVYTTESPGCNVSFNDISNNYQEGVWLAGSPSSTVESNSFLSNGINALRLANSDDSIVMNNTVQSNSGWGIRLSTSDNCLLENNTVSMNGDVGIEIKDSFDCAVTNNTLTLNEEGIHLYSSQNITIINNLLGENVRGGIGFRGSLECVVENNTIDDGVYFHGYPLSYCLHNISGNTIQGKELGYLVGINDTHIDGSQYGQVILINCENITVQDGLFDSVMVGIEILHSTNCTVIDNDIINSGYFGMYIGGTVNGTVTNNTITDGLWYGLHIGGGTNNFLIYENVIGWNVLWNAWDDGTNIYWNNSIGVGNSWGDYNGTGIYEIRSNFVNSYDYHPQKADTDNPTIEPLSDIDYIEDSIANVITWVARDSHPKLFMIYSNDTKVHEGIWDGVDIEYSIDGLPLGVYNYSITVYDTCYNFASESVLVIVRDGTPPIVNSPDDISYVVGEIGHTIIWTPEDSHPASFAIYLDSLLVASGIWNSSEDLISFNVDGLQIGLHNVTIVLVDEAGNSAVDMVTVEVVSIITTSQTTTSPTTTVDDEPIDVSTLILVGAGIGFVLLLVILFRKSRK